MNLNKLLCRYFDPEDRGYVTVGDVVSTIGFALLCLAFGAGVPASIGYLYFRGAILYSQGASPIVDGVSVLDAFAFAVFEVLTVVGSILVVYTVACKLASIRVATCERKDTGGKDE